MAFSIPIPTSRFLNADGMLDRQWYHFLNNLQIAVGGGITAVTNGGTGLTSGTSGGILGFVGTAAMASSSLLAANGIVIGGGAGATPSSTAAGTNGQLLVGQTGVAPLYKTLSGDATLAASGAITVTKTNGSTIPAQTVGSWTPADNSGAGLAFTGISANYTQLGNMVYAYATWTYPVTVNGAAASISGLPVTVANANYAQVPSIVATTAGLTVVLVPTKNTLTAAFDLATTLAAVTNAQLSAATIEVMLIYPVT